MSVSTATTARLPVTAGPSPQAGTTGAAPDTDGAPPTGRGSSPAARVGMLIVAVLVGLAVWYPLADRHTPFASGASITALVTQISPRIAGPVSAVLVQDNAEVKAGQPLFTIDDTTFRMDLALAEAQRDQAVQSLDATNAAVAAAQAQLDRIRVQATTATQARDRAVELFATGTIARAKFDQANADYDSAQAAIAAASADVGRAQAQAGPAGQSNPQWRSAAAAVEKARFALANTTVLAPVDGYITNLSLATGQFATAGQAAMTFIDPATRALIGDFRENQLVDVAPGDSVQVIFEAAPGHVFAGTVESIAWGISSGRSSVGGLAQSSTDTRWFPPARKIPVRVVLADDAALPANLRLGSEASITIFANGTEGFVPAIASGLMQLKSWLAGLN
mgnify:CR=1 FL=1